MLQPTLGPSKCDKGNGMSNSEVTSSIAQRFNAISGPQWFILSLPLVSFLVLKLSGASIVVRVDLETGLTWLGMGYALLAFFYGIAWIWHRFVRESEILQKLVYSLLTLVFITGNIWMIHGVWIGEKAFRFRGGLRIPDWTVLAIFIPFTAVLFWGLWTIWTYKDWNREE